MYINDRDQINYHGFLRALRAMHGVPQGYVSKGICTTSGMNRFENGNRIAEKLMRDRLTARLGISGETYEDYLLPKEYDAWKHRMRIIKAIEERTIVEAQKELAQYEKRPKLNNLNKQFIKAMQYNILLLEGASEEELFTCVTDAIKHTVPSVEKALARAHLLADQEVNLLAERIYLCKCPKVVCDINAWRIGEYEKLISYIDTSRWEKLQKAKVYPKIAYYIGKCLMAKDCSETDLKRGLELCDEAIDLLRDTSRLYYFIELLEMRRSLAERMIKEFSLEKKIYVKLQSMLDENNTWERVFKELYAEYHVPVYMSNFCYLYYETECHNMVEVEELRRTMLGISRIKLCEGVCADRTLIRIEREGANPTIEVMRRLFEKMGLCAEYKRAPIITTDADVLTIDYERLVRAANDVNVEEGLKIIDYIKSRINMDLPFNKQEICRVESCLLYRNHEIDAEVFGNTIIRALNYTMPSQTLRNRKKKYLTIEEIVCVNDLAFDVSTEFSDACYKILEEMCMKAIGDGVDVAKGIKLEFVLERFASALGDAGRYKESSSISDLLLKECLTHYRMKILANLIYNRIWNNQQVGIIDKQNVIKGLERCVILSNILRKYNVSAFFQNKIDKQ